MVNTSHAVANSSATATPTILDASVRGDESAGIA
jgi:hypothetical protein